MNKDYKHTGSLSLRSMCTHLSISIVILFVCMLPGINLSAQNIVPNPSFEQLDFTPCIGSNSHTDFENTIAEWYAPNLGTSDVYSTDLPTSCAMSLPHSTAEPGNWLPRGTQMPRTGNHVVGFKPFFDNRREYIAIKLSCKLVPGKEYYAEMYVSLSEQTNYAQNNIGMYFSATKIFKNNYNYLDLEPQIVETNVIADSVNWVKISGTFVADSEAEHLIIGSFDSEAESDILYLGDKGDISFAYYFVDDVLVEAVDPTPAALSVSGDTTLCLGETLSLTASGASNIKWYNAAGVLADPDSVLTARPAASTTYEARSVGCNNEGRLTKQIVVYIPVLENIGNDTALCEGESIDLNAPNSTTHQWYFNGHLVGTTPALLADQAGHYQLLARDANYCLIGDSLRIRYYESPAKADLGPDLHTCEMKGVLSLTPENDIHYLWQDGSTDASYTYNGPGEYYVTASNTCGASTSDTITITAVELFIPNLITANDDNKNDAFEIRGGDEETGALTIFNRFGAAIYIDSSYNNDWKAESVVEGVYYYEYRYPTCEVRKGWVQIIK